MLLYTVFLLQQDLFKQVEIVKMVENTAIKEAVSIRLRERLLSKLNSVKMQSLKKAVKPDFGSLQVIKEETGEGLMTPRDIQMKF